MNLLWRSHFAYKNCFNNAEISFIIETSLKSYQILRSIIREVIILCLIIHIFDVISSIFKRSMSLNYQNTNPWIT
jgi:hypothetical protein